MFSAVQEHRDARTRGSKIITNAHPDRYDRPAARPFGLRPERQARASVVTAPFVAARGVAGGREMSDIGRLLEPQLPSLYRYARALTAGRRLGSNLS